MTVRILIGDALARLRELPDESVHCCVTSPPYWGLRDYGTARWDGGDAACDHFMPPGGGTKASGLAKYANGLNGETIAAKVEQRRKQYPGECDRCGAARRDEQIGLEPTPGWFIDKLVLVFAEVWRVLRADGTCWINIGDSYCSSPRTAEAVDKRGSRSERLANGRRDQSAVLRHKLAETPPPARPAYGLKPKDLYGVPWRLAFALQDDGWYLRSDIIWSKPNPMPESVTDRPTKAHEYVFLLTKSPRYSYDTDAIRSPLAAKTFTTFGAPDRKPSGAGELVKSDNWGRGKIAERKPKLNAAGEPVGANALSVWTIAPEPFPDAHFATFPPALAERCILAGCPKGGTVLDPFGGAGTTGLVADRLQRDAVLIELNPAYAEMARARIADAAPLLADVHIERGAA